MMLYTLIIVVIFKISDETIGKVLTTIKAKDPDTNASLVYDFLDAGMKAFLSGRIPVDVNKYDFTVSSLHISWYQDYSPPAILPPPDNCIPDNYPPD